MKTADKFLIEGAEIYAERNKIYGDNWIRFSKVMLALFPNGISLKTEDDFSRFQLFSHVVAKQTRYSNNWDVGGHADSSIDLSVYGAMLSAIDEEIRSRTK